MQKESAEVEESFKLPEGWHVMHLFYHVNHGVWSELDESDKDDFQLDFEELIDEIKLQEGMQVQVYAMATPKADLGVMLVGADLEQMIYFEKRITLGLGVEVLVPAYSYYSHTERSEYTTTADQYAQDTLIEEKGLTPDSEEWDKEMAIFEERIKHYTSHRIYPKLPKWGTVCFYPMSKKREGNDNWFALTYEQRKDLMKGHAKVGRTYSGRVLQLITGSCGLDEYEWGVTLWGKSTYDIKAIIYEMRFDEVSSKYADFGDFYIGIQIPLKDIFRQLSL